MRQLCIVHGTQCACVARPVVAPYGDHYLCCSKGGHIYARHQHLQSVGDEMAKSTGLYSTVHGLLGLLPHQEWQNNDGEALKPDQKVHEWHEDGRTTLFDYNVSHPGAPSYVAAASRNQLHAAKLNEKEKNRVYERASEANGYAFSPVCFESHGAFGDSAVAFLDRAADIIRNKLPEGTVTTWTASSFRAFYAQRFSIALQRGNARCIGLRAARDVRLDGRAGMEPPAHAH